MSSRNTSPVLDRVLKAGLVTPALALTILAGAAFAQQGGISGRVYEVIVEPVEDEAGQQDRRDRRAESPARTRGGTRPARSRRSACRRWSANLGAAFALMPPVGSPVFETSV